MAYSARRRTRHRPPRPIAGHLYIGETVATAGLILVIFALASSGRAHLAPIAFGAYIGSAYWFTSSTSFANPAVTIGRAFSDTFAGIAPSTVPLFIVFQAGGAILGAALIITLYPNAAKAADDVVTPHTDLTVDTNTAGASS